MPLLIVRRASHGLVLSFHGVFKRDGFASSPGKLEKIARLFRSAATSVDKTAHLLFVKCFITGIHSVVEKQDGSLGVDLIK